MHDAGGFVMKTKQQGTQTRKNPRTVPAAQSTVQKKKDASISTASAAPSLERPQFQSRFADSPHLQAQSENIDRVFGSNRQNKGTTVVSQQKHVKPHPSDGGHASVVQRDLGDKPLVDFIKNQGARAKTAYDLLCAQVEAGNTQVRMLEFYSEPIENEANAELATAKQRIAETANALRGHISGLPDAASDARATAVGLANASSLATPHALLDQWSKDVLAAVKIVAFAQARSAGILVKIKQEAVKMAQIAMAEQEIPLMRGLLKVADESDAAAAEGDRVIAELNGDDSVSSSGKEKAGLVATASDALNNAATGVGFGVVGALDAGNVFSLSTTAAAALGIVGGALGIFFGAIGTFLGVKNAIQGARKKKALKNAKSKLSNAELEEIANYAIEQKGKKVKRNVAATVGGLIAITAGVLGLIAVSVATFGVAAIVAGIVAALIGLGFLGFKIIRNWRKRKAERTAFADELISQIQGGEEDAEQSRQIVSGVGLDPGQIEQKGFRKKLIRKVGIYIASKRTRMAQGLVRALVSGKPSEVFDAELILGALGIDPEWIKAQVEADKANKAVGKVAGKLASW